MFQPADGINMINSDGSQRFDGALPTAPLIVKVAEWYSAPHTPPEISSLRR